MPLSADPNARAEFSLSVDAGKPKASRPVFLVRFMTRAEHDRQDQLRQDAYACPATAEGNAECWRKCWESINVGITGWRNFNALDGKPLPFTEEGFTAAQLTDYELWELMRDYPSVVRISMLDRRFFVSPSPTPGDSSAAVATTASAGLPTDKSSSPTIAQTA